MKLYEINFIPNCKNAATLNEGYSRVYDFDYQGNQVTDPRPKALSLGKWKSKRGNDLMAGINLNYLSPEQITRLQQNIQPILRSRNLKKRAQALRHLMPDVFNSAYRTYYKDAVNNVDAGTLKFLSSPKEVDPDTSTMSVPQPESDPNASTKASDLNTRSGIDLTKNVSNRHTKPDQVKPEPEPIDTNIIEPKKPIEPEEPKEPVDIGSDEVEPEDIDGEEES